MTATNMDLRELLEKTADTDFLREMIGFTAQRLMELEVETLTGAAHGSRNTDRLTHRNGYRGQFQLHKTQLVFSAFHVSPLGFQGRLDRHRLNRAENLSGDRGVGTDPTEPKAPGQPMRQVGQSQR
jgi:hypothetical protein